MKSQNIEIESTIGTAMGGGFYAGCIMVEGQAYAIIVAPKDKGEIKGIQWNDYRDSGMVVIPCDLSATASARNYENVEGAKSYNDGLANTKAMAEAGSKAAQWALDLRIDGHDDWYIPSQDELEIIYRNLKPTTEENSQYARSGINLSAIEPTRPYTETEPAQTKAELFQKGGSEAFEEYWYWASTPYLSRFGQAWLQYFNDGSQNYCNHDHCGLARAIRKLPI